MIDMIGWIAFNVIAFIILAPWIEMNGLLGLAAYFIFAFGITFLGTVVLPIMRETRGGEEIDDAKKD